MTLPKIASPSPAIFTSDPIEQIYAKGTLDRNMSGLSALMLYGAQKDRQGDQDQYLGSLRESNRMANDLARHEEAQKLRAEQIHAVTKLAPEGYDPATMAGGEMVFPGGGGSSVAKMLQDLIASKAFANRQKGAGGSGTKDSTTVQSIVMPWKDASGNWVQGPTTITGKAATPQQATGNVDVARQKMAGAIMADPNITKEQKAQMLSTLSRQRNVEE